MPTSAYHKYRTYYDKKARAQPLKVNDFVFLLDSKCDSQSIKEEFELFHWQNPYRVLNVLSNSNYIIRKGGSLKTQYVHTMRLNPLKPDFDIDDVSVSEQIYPDDEPCEHSARLMALRRDRLLNRTPRLLTRTPNSEIVIDTPSLRFNSEDEIVPRVPHNENRMRLSPRSKQHDKGSQNPHNEDDDEERVCPRPSTNNQNRYRLRENARTKTYPDLDTRNHTSP